MSIPEKFKAAYIAGAAARVSVEEHSIPAPEAGELAIKITATAINPVDWKIREYGIFLKQWPAILGSDAAGEVVALGPDVSGFAVGDRVFFQGIIGNYNASTFQQYCKMPAALVSKTPNNITDDQAAGISLATVATVTGLYDKTGRGLTPPWAEGGDQVGKGKAIVIIGGSSSVGQYAIQFARLSGFEKIITNASSEHREFLVLLGAHVVLDRSSSKPEDFAAELGGLPLEVVFDSIAIESTQRLGVEVLQTTKTENSSVITVQATNAEAVELGKSKEPKVEVKQILGLGSSPALRHLTEPMARHLGDYVAAGRLIPNRPVVVPGGLQGLDEALEKNKQGVSGVKVVIRPQE